MAKEKKVRERVNWNRELKLAPGYLILCLWILFIYRCITGLGGGRQLFNNKGDFLREDYVQRFSFGKLCEGME